ncbi:hypothetical protein QLS71_000385 [Mariniflexile litorale]|uniref:Lipoprotein n=1 Tax=Mariniflexile litorale TaxID=3045158 RepID=A0AAU7EFW3_9FLAO|nr:hypothetical protein [Mariniflexile sp. KMM 9835]MDQ8212000.1 hypothetical protein [Mariniflexile sp. KMM 9835]
MILLAVKMKFKKSLMINFSFCFCLIAIILLESCEAHSGYYFEKSQSKVIDSLRHLGHYEYNSRLNDSLCMVLNNPNNKLMTPTTYTTIVSITNKLSKTKSSGCYVIDWQTLETKQNFTNVILLEWNPNGGIIIRMFTRNKYLKEKLPKQSF